MAPMATLPRAVQDQSEFVCVGVYNHHSAMAPTCMHTPEAAPSRSAQALPIFGALLHLACCCRHHLLHLFTCNAANAMTQLHCGGVHVCGQWEFIWSVLIHVWIGRFTSHQSFENENCCVDDILSSSLLSLSLFYCDIIIATLIGCNAG